MSTHAALCIAGSLTRSCPNCGGSNLGPPRLGNLETRRTMNTAERRNRSLEWLSDAGRTPRDARELDVRLLLGPLVASTLVEVGNRVPC